MNLESLPNEILLDLFDYFNDVDLLRIFDGLNSRFNFLFYNQYRSYCFKFKSISQRIFDMVCQQHLPCLADRVIALSLSDGKETPEQIDRFFSYIPSFSTFIHLRSLTIFHLRSYETTLKITHRCHDLCHLSHLKFHPGIITDNHVQSQTIINNIWKLPNLTHCDLGIFTKGWSNYCCTPTVISTSLKYVSILRCELGWEQINQLFYSTPYLTHLALSIKSTSYDDYIPYCLPQLIRLNIDLFSKVDILKLISFFQYTPNLRTLNISLWGSLINGQQWEQIISTYLPKLQIFQLKMDNIPHSRYNPEVMKVPVHELVNSFRSPFWIDEHQWFVRCLTQNNNIYLHTLSSTFNYYNADLPDSWTSTYPNDHQSKFHGNIIRIYDETFFNQSIPSDIRLSNIQSLRIKCPINDQFWFIVPTLKRLDSLSIFSYTDQFYSQLQALLDRAPQLRCLHIHQKPFLPLRTSFLPLQISYLPFQTSFFKCTNTSIRRLALQNCNHYFTHHECQSVSRSSLGIQCEVLSLMVKHRESIVYLIKKLLNLRILSVQCKDDKNSEQCAVTTNDNEQSQNKHMLNKDELVLWLIDYLPSTCSIVRDSDSTSRIRICL